MADWISIRLTALSNRTSLGVRLDIVKTGIQSKSFDVGHEKEKIDAKYPVYYKSGCCPFYPGGKENFT